MSKVKILSYVVHGNMIRLELDDPDVPEVCYFVDKFSSKEALQREIDKKVARVKKIKKVKKEKKDRLEAELNE